MTLKNTWVAGETYHPSDQNDIATQVNTNTTKLSGIEALADVTDAGNVDAAGAVMNSDTSTAAMTFVVDEDAMTSNSATKVPSQQSVKAYVDAHAGGGDASTNTSASVDGEVALFSGTAGKTIKRATGTGLLKLASGVQSTVAAPSGAVVGTTDAQNLGSKTLTLPTITGYVESVVANGTVTTSKTLSLASGTVQTATLTAATACTFTMPTATAGTSFVLYLKQPASTGLGSATFTGVKWPAATAPTITSAAGRMDIVSFVADGTSWYGSITQNYTY